MVLNVTYIYIFIYTIYLSLKIFISRDISCDVNVLSTFMCYFLSVRLIFRIIFHKWNSKFQLFNKIIRLIPPLYYCYLVKFLCVNLCLFIIIVVFLLYLNRYYKIKFIVRIVHHIYFSLVKWMQCTVCTAMVLLQTITIVIIVYQVIYYIKLIIIRKNRHKNNI